MLRLKIEYNLLSSWHKIMINDKFVTYNLRFSHKLKETLALAICNR